ncbi:structural maintenance of chromosomes protein 5 isoform X2 [Ricinus communis]|uniref:structural maintenance of chromosomes protein 5 isoform X2 n=1 Tax=Ricinus communis TaxID=3988 RepID=UPI000772B416|nr:structural maintenance of chromosomes protein 5 isoform X2 [Ricinus communis]|eukprot:XP_015573871.1 structural maintenance of chromosomes protein 5 isoform X2 [Ricinus communis]
MGQLLGRATSVGAYVKRGEECAYIKISLRGNTKDERITIMRKIDTHNKSEWLYNGKVVPKKEIGEITQRFNIQVNNLTQFLPQDRVCEFAKLTPVQLLEETEKAVGDPQLPIQHRALVEKSRELKNIEVAVERNGETLNQLKALNAELEKDVERVRQREELLEKVEWMKKKLPWLKYDMKKAEYLEAKEQEKDAQKKLEEAVKIMKDLKEPIDKQKKDKSLLDSKCKKVLSLINENTKQRMELLEKENHLEVNFKGKRKEMEDLKRQEESRQQRILKAKNDLTAAEIELRNLPTYEPPTDVFGRLHNQIVELQFSAKEKRLQKSETEKLLDQKRLLLKQCLDKLKDMEDTKNKLLQALRNSGAEKIFDAYKWVEQHRNELKAEVYGPVLLEVNVSDRMHADYLEGQVPYYIWKSFITQDPTDRDVLVKNLKAFDVPILNYVRDESHPKEAFQVSEKMHELGIYSRLDQVFDAPHAVKEVLISQFGLDRSYIGSKETDQKADEVAKLKIWDFWTPENHYRWSPSRYGGHVSGSVEPVDRSRLLLCSSDSGEIERLKCRKHELQESVTALEESFKVLQREQRQLENEEAELQKEREEIISNVQHEKRKRKDMENLVNQRKRKLESVEKEVDLDTSMAKLIDESENIKRERLQCAIAIKNLLFEAVSNRWSLAEKHMATIEFDTKIRELEFNLKQHEKVARQAALHVEYCKKEVEEHRQQLSSAKISAESVSIITPELEKAFLEMPTTIEELEAAIQDNMSQANSILFLNHNVLEEYEHRQQKIESMTRKLEADKEELKRCLAEIDDLKESWLPTLRNLVARINETFSRNFQEMAVAGEVSLDEHDKDFDQYGILIKVKFRQAGQLQVLSAHHQSGGERSVSTVLYLVSLQDLTNCPFRVVDEINQGMDPINERKMFQQLVRAASQPNTPQCFLLTPKLLPDLEYSEACSILNIMNGPWIEQPAKVWSSGESWRAVARLVGET